MSSSSTTSPRYSDIRYDWRSSSYWDPPADVLQVVLQNIRGTKRREMIQDFWDAGRLQELDDVFLQDELTNEDRESLGRVHPSFMGGEYLSRSRKGEVTIARIDLESVMGDAIEVRAAPSGKRIRYRVVDEHETEFTIYPKTSRQPLSLGQLVELIDHASPDPSFEESLALYYTAANYESGECLEGLESFTSLYSDVYPELGKHYHRVLAGWFEAKHKELAVTED
jgi:hypothetical protein